MKTRGFTLIELIAVLVLVGILAVAAMPRFFDKNVFESRGFADETKSLLRYAQKAAIAQRRTVCVTLGATGAALMIASAAGVPSCNTVLALPSPPRGGTGLTSSVTTYNFNSDGSTNQAADVSINIVGVVLPIVVDKVTGYVR